MAQSIRITEQQHVPMFMTPENNNSKVPNTDVNISVFDVKDLYDRAYAAKDQGLRGKAMFRKLLAKAVKLDLAYRRQLAQGAIYTQ